MWSMKICWYKSPFVFLYNAYSSLKALAYFSKIRMQSRNVLYNLQIKLFASERLVEHCVYLCFWSTVRLLIHCAPEQLQDALLLWVEGLRGGCTYVYGGLGACTTGHGALWCSCGASKRREWGWVRRCVTAHSTGLASEKTKGLGAR